jgi:hypothetical protein
MAGSMSREYLLTQRNFILVVPVVASKLDNSLSCLWGSVVPPLMGCARITRLHSIIRSAKPTATVPNSSRRLNAPSVGAGQQRASRAINVIDSTEALWFGASIPLPPRRYDHPENLPVRFQSQSPLRMIR